MPAVCDCCVPQPCIPVPCIPPPPSQAPAPTPTRVHGDPHFVGKHGERFDFNGQPGHDYCLIADRRTHVNMRVFGGKRKGTTYISEVGILHDNNEIFISAKSAENVGWRGFHGMVLINGIEMPAAVMNLTVGQLTIARTRTAVELIEPGRMDIVLDIARAAHWKNGPGENFLNLRVNYLKVSPRVHGVLGQTYRESERTYKKLGRAEIKGQKNAFAYLVDGEEKDYETSGIMAADCKYARFKLPAKPEGTVRRLFSFLQRSQTTEDDGPVVEKLFDYCIGFGGASLCRN